jgi:hypothetical protein
LYLMATLAGVRISVQKIGGTVCFPRKICEICAIFIANAL